MKPHPVWISGEPPTFLTAGEAAWKARIREALPESSLHSGNGLRLSFVVSSWRRHGQLFDADNLAKPVLDVLRKPEVPFVEVTVRLDESPGVEISATAVPSRSVPPTVWLHDLPRGSKRRLDMHPALIGIPHLEGEGPVRLHLHVHEPDSIVDFDFTGFIKPTIDSLWPLFGGVAHAPGDHRIKHLVITRSKERPSGVSIGIELLE